jgi:hypothetical protein
MGLRTSKLLRESRAPMLVSMCCNADSPLPQRIAGDYIPTWGLGLMEISSLCNM